LRERFFCANVEPDLAAIAKPNYVAAPFPLKKVFLSLFVKALGSPLRPGVVRIQAASCALNAN